MSPVYDIFFSLPLHTLSENRFFPLILHKLGETYFWPPNVHSSAQENANAAIGLREAEEGENAKIRLQIPFSRRRPILLPKKWLFADEFTDFACAKK